MKKNYIKFQRSTSIMGSKKNKIKKSTKLQMDPAEEQKFEDLQRGLQIDTTTGPYNFEEEITETEGSFSRGGGVSVQGTKFSGVK